MIRAHVIAVVLLALAVGGCGPGGAPSGDELAGDGIAPAGQPTTTTADGADSPLDEDLASPLDEDAEQGLAGDKVKPASGASEINDPAYWTITLNGPNEDGYYELKSLGTFPMTGTNNRNFNVGSAETYWGPAKNLKPSKGICTVTFFDGQAAIFMTLSGTPPNTSLGETWCDRPAETVIQSVAFTDGQWRTDKGLRVGNDLKRLKQLYPDAKSYPGDDAPGTEYALANRYFPIGDSETAPVLQARVQDGKVTALMANPGKAGE